MKKIIILLLLAASVAAAARTYSENIYFVAFADKADSPYSISSPEEYLSPASIARRVRLGIAIDSLDLPVSPSYAGGVARCGASVLYAEKWHNGVIAEASDSAIAAVADLPYVVSVELLRSRKTTVRKPGRKTPRSSRQHMDEGGGEQTFPQRQQIGIDRLCDMGFRGKGVTVAVIDGGFVGVEGGPAFDSINARGQILGTFNLTDPEVPVYAPDYVSFGADTHGTKCLSAIVSNQPSALGTAPDAWLYLFKSEIDGEESPFEAELLACAMEMADSVGADVLSCSLGYSQFDNSALNYSHSDLDGRTLRCSRSATIALGKGIVPVVAAGNEGNRPWHIISVPADAEGALAVGAVDAGGFIAAFSSRGPAADGRVKPDLCARGSETIVYDPYAGFVPGSGTSFACPLVAGMMASLLSALPDISPAELCSLARSTASRGDSPDNAYGYGVPDAMRIYRAYTDDTAVGDLEGDHAPFALFEGGRLLVGNIAYPAYIDIFSASGILLRSMQAESDIEMPADDLRAGVYLLVVRSSDGVDVLKVVKP